MERGASCLGEFDGWRGQAAYSGSIGEFDGQRGLSVYSASVGTIQLITEGLEVRSGGAGQGGGEGRERRDAK